MATTASQRARDVLKKIARRRHRNDTSGFIGWFAFPVLDVEATRQIQIDVCAAPIRMNPLHAEISFDEDLRLDNERRKVCVDDLIALGEWKACASI